MKPDPLPDPWHSFFRELDAQTTAKIQLHCLGGFVVTMQYGLNRPTADVDILKIVPHGEIDSVMNLAGKRSPLHKKYGVYLDLVTVASVPENYETRLAELGPKTFQRIRLFALDPYDLALTKLERNLQRDRDDVKHLARTVPLDISILRQRYQIELRPYLLNEKKHDLTLQLWIEIIEEQKETNNRTGAK